MTLRPLDDRIIVQRIDEGEQNVGGIIIPDTAKQKPQQGTVIAAGTGNVKEDRRRIPLDVIAGDRILFGKSPGDHAGWRGVPHQKKDDVLAVIEGHSKKKLAAIKGKTERKKK